MLRASPGYDDTRKCAFFGAKVCSVVESLLLSEALGTACSRATTEALCLHFPSANCLTPDMSHRVPC